MMVRAWQPRLFRRVVRGVRDVFDSTTANDSTGSDGLSTGTASSTWQATAATQQQAEPVTTTQDSNDSGVCEFDLTSAQLLDNAGTMAGFLILILVTVVGNSLIVLAIQKDVRLKTVGNMYYQSLATADLLVGLLVMPLMLLYTLHDCWPLGIRACDLWMSVDLICSTASFLGLCAIAADRYQAISDPFKHMKTKSRSRTMLAIAGVWLFAGLGLIPAIVIRALSGDEVDYDCDYRVSVIYVMVSSIVIYYVPIVTMITLYALLFLALRRQLRAAKPESRPKLGEGKPTTCTSSQIALESSVTISEVDGGGESKVALPDVRSSTYGNDLAEKRARDEERSRINKERRAASMLGIIMMVFLICWLPWAVTWPIGAFREEWISDSLYDISSWAAYINSVVNPFLYVFSNADFRRSLARIVGLRK